MMKTKLYLSIILLALFFSVYEKVNAQSPNFLWAKRIGGTTDDYGYSIAIDASGNVYTTGVFSGTVDFDPGAGTFNLTSGGGGDIFISKLDGSGNFVWAKHMGGAGGVGLAEGRSIAIDASGNIYTTGYFILTADFDPDSSAVFNLTASGNHDIFISKLDSSGNFVWAKAIGGTGSFGANGNSIIPDDSGNIYVTGDFNGTVDFDPNAGTFNLTSTGISNDVFISKLDASGNLVWAKHMGGPGTADAQGLSIARDTSGNIYSTGYFRETVDFDPGASTFNLTSAGSNDIFISRLDSSGNFVWAKQMGGATNNGDAGFSIALDASGNVYTTGYFAGDPFDIADFDPGPGTFNLTTAGNADLFISKLNNSGNFVWAKRIGGPLNDFGNSIVIDASGNVYTTGYFYGTIDFNPGAGTFNLTSVGIYDIFISKLNNSGNFVWAKAMGGTSYDAGQSLALDASGNVYMTGSFRSPSITFGSTTLTNADATGFTYDIFIAKLDTALITGNNDASTPLSMTSIYPNPATNQLAVSSGQFVINSIEIYDIRGQKVYSEQLKTGNTKSETKIDVSKLPGGIYFVQLKSEDFIEMKKLIVTK